MKAFQEPSPDKESSHTIRTLVRRPFLLWVIYLLVVALISLGAKALFPALEAGSRGLSVLQLGGQVLLTLLPLPFVMAIGWREAGFTGPPAWRNLHVVLFPALTVAFGFLAGFRAMDIGYVATAVALVTLVAIGEEAAFRGVFLKLFLPKGVPYAVAVTSILFGLMHVANLLLGMPWQGVLLQVLFATLTGVGFAAVRIRTGSLWPAIVLHAVYDLAFRVGDFQPLTAFSNTFYMLNGVGWVIFAIVVLRPTVKRSRLAPAA